MTRGAALALVVVGIAAGVGAGCGKKGPRLRQDKDAQLGPPPGSDAGGGAVRGATTEAEPNDTPDHATPVALGQTARGALDGSTDVDVYKLAVTGAGAMSVTLSAIDGVDLALEITDPSGKVIAASDRGPAATPEGVPNLAVVAGDYRLTVKEFVKPAKKDKKRTKVDAAPAGRTGPSPTYELVANLVKPVDGAEREPDDDPGAANDLYPGDSVTGYVGWTGDKDVWKLALETLTVRNAFDVEVSGVDGVAITVEVSDADGKTLQTRKGVKGMTVALPAIAPRQPEGAAPFHYITISGDRSNPEAAYTLTVRGRALDLDQEVEPNDKPDVAQALTEDHGTVHAQFVAGDVDCFAFAPNGDAQALVFTAVPPDGVDAVVEVSGATGLLSKTDLGGAGADEKAEVTIPSGVTASACVSFKPVKADPGAARDYDVEYSLEPAEDELPPEER